MWSKPTAAAASPTSPTSPRAAEPAASPVARPGRRVAQVVRLRPEHAAAYRAAHASVWPEVLAAVRACNIRDCQSSHSSVPYLPGVGAGADAFRPAADSIFHDAEAGLLYASFRYVGYDYAGDMARMRDDPKVRQWWAMTDAWQESLVPGATDSAAEPPAPSWWKPLDEVFYTP